ncbi:MAG: hypothetical protein ACJASC_003197 [Limimaricola cinnabarinus]|jgi:uncharacterized protein YjiS (DUF1127 family)|uniref:YjiS-like domain-containing protein n=1 Tax=Limimaricola cinnabarinus LL-001 TaxID=1337093 RepID=U2Z5V6_9RHOB|nr:DUF1127 domain-containing protein [Limimaricola cinnabarinus]GAD56790.1 hypothetical protein MBELCI_2842 [Limimaricola cinnabarinus LL-001]
MTTLAHTATPFEAALDQGAVSALLVGMARRVAIWERRARTRRALSRLDAAMLRDLGLDPMTAQAEAARPFWKG